MKIILGLFSVFILFFNLLAEEEFETKPFISLDAGVGFAYLSWESSSYVDDDNKNKYAELEYDIAQTIYTSIYIQGQINNIELALSYMQNRAQQKGGLVRDANNLFSFFVDINDFISPQNSIKLIYENANVNGLATFNDENYGGINLTPIISPIEFKSDLKRISLLIMMKEGAFFGGEYDNYTIPSALGFVDRYRDLKYYGVDKDFGIKNFKLVAGYDTASYAKENEIDYSTFYMQGSGGVGLSVYDISDSFKENLQNISNKDIVQSKYSLVLEAQVQVGYLWQQRFESLKGLGYSFDTGIKVRGNYTGISASDDADIDYNELHMRMKRYDIWYGPFINCKIIF
jgi:hypothetical protein